MGVNNWLNSIFNQINKSRKMKSIKQLFSLAILAGLFIFASCSKDKQAPTMTMTIDKQMAAVGDDINIGLMADDESPMEDIQFTIELKKTSASSTTTEQLIFEAWPNDGSSSFSETYTFTVPVTSPAGDSLMTGDSLLFSFHARDDGNYFDFKYGNTVIK